MRKFLGRMRITSFQEFYLLMVALLIPWQTISIVQKGVTPFHVINFFVLLFLLLSPMQRRIRWPFALPLFIYLIGSLLGMFSSKFIAYNLYTLGQDFYLYAWFALMAVVLSSEKRVEFLVLAWILIVGIVLVMTDGKHVLANVGDDARLEFSFRNPNRAAAYFLFSSFLLLHPLVPKFLRIMVVPVCVLSVLGTGSTGGLLSFAIGVVVFLWAWTYVRAPRSVREFQPVLVPLLLLLAYGVYASTHLSSQNPITVLAQVAPSEERVERSSNTRFQIWQLGLETFKKHPLGIGPASFWQQIESDIGKKYGIELHSDFMGTLVERGIVGFVGFLGFLGAIGLNILYMLRLASDDGDRRRGYWAAVLAGMVVGYLSLSLTHEILHHETLWLSLALLVGHTTLLGRLRAAKVNRLAVARMQALSSREPRRMMPAWSGNRS